MDGYSLSKGRQYGVRMGCVRATPSAKKVTDYFAARSLAQRNAAQKFTGVMSKEIRNFPSLSPPPPFPLIDRLVQALFDRSAEARSAVPSDRADKYKFSPPGKLRLVENVMRRCKPPPPVPITLLRCIALPYTPPSYLAARKCNLWTPVRTGRPSVCMWHLHSAFCLVQSLR